MRSWVASANDPATDFPPQNLPFGIFRRRGTSSAGCIGVAIGDCIVDLAACVRSGVLAKGSASAEFAGDATLNRLMAEGSAVSRSIREALLGVVEAGNSAAARRAGDITLSQSDAELLIPVRVGNYTDFYASINHATNVGTMLRPDNPLLPNYKYVPIGYHGRASSVVVSGTPVRRPVGQCKGEGGAEPSVGPTKSMDYEIEIAALVGAGNARGEPVRLAHAEDHVWGVCLLNDWSARDVQAWEAQPLGPFLSKNFATSISPWVVTIDALAPFRAPAPTRPAGDPVPLPYLMDDRTRTSGGLALTLEVWIRSAAMRAKSVAPMRLSRGSFAEMYWTFGQLLTHHTMGGCNLQPGDLLGSGTVSGTSREAMGCLLERTRRGSEPFDLPGGERRGFLEDGDEVILRGYAERDGVRRIGLGECSGVVTPAI
ncbi:MAG: fumarylacetoacetase [Gemmatimonadota bacterium]